MTRRRFSARALTERLLSYDGKCAVCGFKVGGAAGLEWDHIIPLELGGEDEVSNLQPLCRVDHRAKTRGDVRAIRKAERQRQRSAGIPKAVSRPLPGGKNSPWKSTIGGGWVRREDA